MCCHLTGTDRHPRCLHRGILASAGGEERGKKKGSSSTRCSKTVISSVLFCSFRLISASLGHLTLSLRERIFLHCPVVEAPKKFNHPTEKRRSPRSHVGHCVSEKTGSGDRAGLAKLMYMGSLPCQKQETSCPS